MRKKKRGLLTIELTLLISLLLTIMLFFASLIYLIHIKESVRNAMSEAAKSLSTELYIYSKLSQDTELSALSSAINDRASEELGFRLNLSELASKELLSHLLGRKAYKNLGLDPYNPPFWMAGRIEVEAEALSHSLYITTRIPIRLPVLSLFLKDMSLEVKNVEAARDAEKALTGTIDSGDGDDGADGGTIVICAYSLSGKSKKPVYHDSKCFGRLWEREEDSLLLDRAEVIIDENRDINYEGKTYHYCDLCRINREKEGLKNER